MWKVLPVRCCIALLVDIWVLSTMGWGQMRHSGACGSRLCYSPVGREQSKNTVSAATPADSRRGVAELKAVRAPATRMQRKPVPAAPASLARLGEVRDAVPLVPEPEDDCCRRLVERAGVHDRGAASAWLVFLSALGAVEETDLGYARARGDRDRAALAAGFRENVFLAPEVLAALGDDPRTPSTVFEAVRERVPRWERTKRQNWEAFWTERVERRLDWAVLLGLAERADGGYRRA